jgi:hypothetical protein
LGNFPTTVEYGTLYNIKIYYPESVLRINQDFVPSVNPSPFKLDAVVINTPSDLNYFTIRFTPSIEFLVSGTKVLSQDINSTYGLSKIHIWLDQDNNGVKTVLYDNTVYWLNNYHNDINADANALLHPDYNSLFRLRVCVAIYHDNNNDAFNNMPVCHYYKAADSNSLNWIQRLTNLRNDPAGFACNPNSICFGTSILAILLTIMIVGAIGWATLKFDALANAALAFGVLGLFTYIGWFDILLYVPILIIGILLMRGDF